MNCTSIIRCKNEDRWIGHAIQSFLDFFPEGEIIVVDNNSTDRSMEIVSLFDYANIKRINIEDYTPGRAINLGVQEASHENILIQSSHCVIKKFNKPHVFGNLKEIPCIFGKQTPYYLGKRISKRYIWSHFKNEEEVNMFSDIEDRYFLHNALCMYTKQILLDIPVDERLSGKEDRYWAKTLVDKGGKFLYSPNGLSCDHHYTENGNTWKGIG